MQACLRRLHCILFNSLCSEKKTYLNYAKVHLDTLSFQNDRLLLKNHVYVHSDRRSLLQASRQTLNCVYKIRAPHWLLQAA